MKGSFFCEACGAEVKGRSDRCPSCGRSFLGIRCPRCGKEGISEEFIRGCPDCGYLADSADTGLSEKTYPGRVKKLRKPHRTWPASRYWALSALVLAGIGIILYIWL